MALSSYIRVVLQERAKTAFPIRHTRSNDRPVAEETGRLRARRGVFFGIAD